MPGVGNPCICNVRDKSKWVVVHRSHNHSYFKGPRGSTNLSEFSGLKCLNCGNEWRSKGAYVAKLRDLEVME